MAVVTERDSTARRLAFRVSQLGDPTDCDDSFSFGSRKTCRLLIFCLPEAITDAFSPHRPHNDGVDARVVRQHHGRHDGPLLLWEQRSHGRWPNTSHPPQQPTCTTAAAPAAGRAAGEQPLAPAG